MIKLPSTTEPLWLQGDVLDRLADIPDDSIQCVVSSPPYWGLRDYGTADWEGGDAECEHKVGRFETPCSGKQKSNTGSAGHQARDACPRCGAIRIDKQIGLEPTLQDWLDKMVAVFREVRRVLRPDGTLWLNIGDAYVNQPGGNRGVPEEWQRQGRKETASKKKHTSDGLKTKDCLMMDYRLALALQADGWWLRSKIVWAKPNPMPESVTDRPTSSYEMIFLLTKSARYFYDADAIREGYSEATIERLSQPTFDSQTGGPKDPKTGNRSPRKAMENLKRSWDKAADDDRGELVQRGRGKTGPATTHECGRNSRNVWTIATHPNPKAHFATFPPELVRRCIAAGTSEKGSCSKCGKPWNRVTKETQELLQATNNERSCDQNNRADMPRMNISRETLGWQPGCDCEKGRYPSTRPCIVLDCFAGIGTSLAVAARMGRASIGIELNPEYIEMGLPDCEAAFRGITAKEVEAGQGTLFDADR